MKTIIGAALFLCCANASAYVIGGSNIYGSYPSFTDYPPSAPYTDDQYAMSRYKDEVERYIEAAKQYTENADSDIQRIREQKAEAISKANDAIEEYNRKINGF
ncbi:hypothetical protein [Morganella morganii]|uniref:hypothetical protein n=1 Tax=Morganella morganii TaxID=582 RepID=UPI000F836BF0|nr:hypothetical protein [Morganella morganii]RTY17551.1 hypothetical protein EKS23_17995 [Morganella morganii subsp. morganii]